MRTFYASLLLAIMPTCIAINAAEAEKNQDASASFFQYCRAHITYLPTYWRDQQKSLILSFYSDAILGEDNEEMLIKLLTALTDYTCRQETKGLEKLNYIIKCVHCIAQTPKWGHESQLLVLKHASSCALTIIMTELGTEFAENIITQLKSIIMNHYLAYQYFSSYTEILKLMGAEIDDTLITHWYEETTLQAKKLAQHELHQHLTEQIKILYKKWVPAPIVIAPAPVRHNNDTTSVPPVKTPEIVSCQAKSAFKQVITHPKTPPTTFDA